jgi:hypothetical protein
LSGASEDESGQLKPVEERRHGSGYLLLVEVIVSRSMMMAEETWPGIDTVPLLHAAEAERGNEP